MPDFRVYSAKSGVPEYDAIFTNPQRQSSALLIPVLNEGERIRAQLIRIREVCPRADVYVADGGSNDGSLEPGWLKDHGVTGLLVKRGPGKLSAQLRMGMAHALGLGYRNILTMDGNGKDGADGINRIVEALEAGSGFVQGSRFVPGGKAVNTPTSRTLGIRLLHAPITSAAARARLTDTTNGFRGHSRKFLLDPRVDPFREVFDTYELLAYLPIRAGQLNYQVDEVPVTRSYPDDGTVPTKIHGFSGNKALLTILLRAARGKYAPTQAEVEFAKSRSDIY